MNAGQAIFLDTTVQTQRALTEPLQLARLETQLTAPTVRAITVSYVWMEYQRTIIADYAHVHRLMYRYGGWDMLLTHLLDGQRAFRPRAAVRCTRIVGKVLGQSYKDWSLARQMLGVQIAYGLRQQFWAHVAPLSDPIGCDLVTAGVNRQPDGTYTVADTCRKEKATCHLPDFLAQRQPQLRAIAQHLATHPNAIKDQTRVERLLAAVLADPRAALGQAACWPLGDVIIALQVPSGTLLWTLDKQDFAALSAPLGLELRT
jgi:hypothetical protein